MLGKSKFGSHLDEDKVVKKLVASIKDITEYCVDIGASDGVTMSNSYKLYAQGWEGVAFECIPEKFRTLAANFETFKVGLSNSAVTPLNIVALLKAYGTPKKFGFLTLDIDGYDYFVLENLLSEYSPSVICAEINEKIPPPLKFTVKFTPEYFWNTSHFYGQSLSQLDELCKKKGYSLATVHYNNAFYVRSDQFKGKPLTAEKAYVEGYKNRKDRKKKFYWNEDFEGIFKLSTDEQVKFVNSKFKEHKNKYILKI